MLIAALLALSATSTVQAQTKSFRPLVQARHLVVFKPTGVAPDRVKGAAVRLRRHGRMVERRLNVRRVRRALRGGHRLRIRKPRKGYAVRLIIDVAETQTCGSGTFSSQNLPGACWRPYSDQSPFNTVVPASPRLISSSAAIVNRVVGFGLPGKHASGNADTPDDWAHPLYYSSSADPTYTVHCTKHWGTCDVEGLQIKIPANARPAGGSDGHLAVIDQSSGWEYDFWQVQQKSSGGGVLLASWGGRTRIDGDGLNSDATASGFGLAAGVIRPPELAAGNINHALFMVVKCTNGTAVWPSDPTNPGTTCSDIGLPNANAPAMGQHFYLGMSDAEIAALNEPGWQKTILRAMAHYGMFVGDTGGDAWGIEFESGSSYTSFGYQDPWEQVGQQFGVPTWSGAPDGKRRHIFDFRNAADWAAKLQVVAPPAA